MTDVYDDDMDIHRVEFNEEEHSPELLLCVMCGGMYSVDDDDCPCMIEDLELD